MSAGRLPQEGTPPPAGDGLEELLGPELARRVRSAIRTEARQALQEARQDAPGDAPAFASKPRAARLLGVSPASLRRWQSAGLISRYDGGRVRLAEVRAVLAGERKPAAKPAAPTVADLAAARAKKAAEQLLGKAGR